MKTCYHLSTESDLEAIVCSNVVRSSNEISPRIPDDCYGESQEVERVCVAPTIWQCLVSIPKSGILFVYEIQTASTSEPIDGLADSHITNEMWITNDDLERAGGRLVMTNIGMVDRTDQLALSLKIQNRMGKLPRDRTEELQIWQINDGQLYLRDELII
jgi:hypothetical protein